MWTFKQILMLKVISDKYLSQKSTHLGHYYLKYTLGYGAKCSISLIMSADVIRTNFSTMVFQLVGYLGPGGLHENGTYFNCTGGSARYLDILLFGRNHIYTHPTSKPIYDSTEPFDPEGSLGALTACFTVFLGVQCGYTLLSFTEWKPRVKRWLSWSVILGILAGGLCGFSKENGIIPINKNLWSLSFALALPSFAFFLLTIM